MSKETELMQAVTELDELTQASEAALGKRTPGQWFYDGEDVDSEAAASWGGNGYEIFTRDKDGEVDEPIGCVIEEEDAKFICAATNPETSATTLAADNARLREEVKALKGQIEATAIYDDGMQADLERTRAELEATKSRNENLVRESRDLSSCLEKAEAQRDDLATVLKNIIHDYGNEHGEELSLTEGRALLQRIGTESTEQGGGNGG